MNKFIKGSLIFLSGAGVGSVITYFVTKRIVEKDKNNEIEIIRNHYKDRFRDYIDSKYEHKPIKMKEDKPVDIPKKEVRAVEPNVVLRVSNEQIDYTKAFKKEQKVEEKKEEKSEEPEYYYEIETDDVGGTGNDSEYLTYYTGSGDLVETMTGDIVSIVDALGPDGNDVLDDRPDEDTFYWRNDLLGLDYEIDCVNEAYISHEIEND